MRISDWSSDVCSSDLAERALLLVRLGDVNGARMLVQAVPLDRYTPRLYAVAAPVALANADIGGLCPIADVGESLSRHGLWSHAREMCGGRFGDNVSEEGRRGEVGGRKCDCWWTADQ